MFIVINKIVEYINYFFNFFFNLSKINLQQSYKNNIGMFRFKLFSDKVTKYKYTLYLYTFVTMTFCPWLDNLFNYWYDVEVYNLYVMLVGFFFLNIFLNMVVEVPTKNTLNLKIFLLKLKSFFFYLNSVLVKFIKLWVFFKNEIFKKSFFLNFLKKNFEIFTNYFIYWRPLFKRFSYFGFYKLTKSKFFKFNK